MDREFIEKEIERLDKLAEKHYRNYQDSGEQKYYRTYEKSESTADVFRLALNSVEEHRELINYRTDFCTLARDADKAIHDSDDKMMQQVLKNLLALARMKGIYESKWI